jgi:predicted CXXCH cytochrome family protein
MKKAFAIALALVAGSASAAVVNSKHNIGNYNGVGSGGAVGGGDVCYFCHAAHNTGTIAPLWARNNPTNGGYTTFQSGTISVNIAGTIDNFSLACMSCHDGTVAVNQTIKGKLGTNAGNVYIAAGNTRIGPDLSNDHPVSLQWPAPDSVNGLLPSVPAPFRTYNTSRGGTALTQAMTCGTCHAVHDTTYSKFLRANPNAAGFCALCHANK